MKTSISKLAEDRVQRYFSERGYGFVHEPDLGIVSRPDFLVTAGEHTVVAEVKAFETYGIFERMVPRQIGARPLDKALRPVRKPPQGSSVTSRGAAGRWSQSSTIPARARSRSRRPW